MLSTVVDGVYESLLGSDGTKLAELEAADEVVAPAEALAAALLALGDVGALSVAGAVAGTGGGLTPSTT